jgi:hypothetical protein
MKTLLKTPAFLLTTTLAIGLLCLCACQSFSVASGTGAGNPSPLQIAFQVRMEGAIETEPALLKATSSNKSISIQDSTGLSFVIDTALIHFGQISIDSRASDCNTPACTGTWTRVSGDWIVDLVRDSSYSALPILDLYPGYYSTIDLTLNSTRTSSAIPSGASMLIVLSFEGSSGRSSLRIPLKINRDLEFQDSTAPYFETNGTLELSLLARQWLQGINIQECLDNKKTLEIAPGVYEAKESSCNKLMGALKENIRKAVKIRKPE